MRKKLLVAIAFIVLLPVAGIAVLFAMREPPDVMAQQDIDARNTETLQALGV